MGEGLSFKLRSEVIMGRKKKTPQEEIRDGLKRLAFGEIQDAVRLLFADEAEVLAKLPEYNLFNISEIKRPKGGGMEIKFFDRIKALEKLREIDGDENPEPIGFYKALEDGARSLSSAAKEYGE